MMVKEKRVQENVPICLIRKWCRLVEAYLIAYDGGMNIIQAESFINKHRSHRSHSAVMDEELEKSFLEAIKNQGLNDFKGDESIPLSDDITLNILHEIQELYFPDPNQDINDDDIENMNDDDDIVVNDEILTTAVVDGNEIINNTIIIEEDEAVYGNLDKIIEEDILITHILGMKSNGVITRSKSNINRQYDDDEDEDDIIAFDNNDAFLELDDDDIEIIDIIEG